MSEENIENNESASFGDSVSVEDDFEETSIDDSKVEETKEEKETVSPSVESESTISVDTGQGSVTSSIGVGGQFYNGPCKYCGSRIANGPIKDNKVHCLKCKKDF